MSSEPGHGPTTAAIVRTIAIIVLAGLLLWAAYTVRHILLLVTVALFLAVGLDPAVRALGRLRVGRKIAVLIVFVLVAGFVAGFVASVTPPMVRQVQTLVRELPQYAEQLTEKSKQFRSIDERFGVTEKLRESVAGAGLAGKGVGGVVDVAKSVGSAFFNFITVLILTIYFLADLPRLLTSAERLLPASQRARFHQLSQPVFERISGYLLGNIMVSVVAGVSTFIACSILRVPYPLALALWVAIADLVPMVGATLGAVPAVIVAFFHSAPTGVGALIYFLAYQQIENYLVAPRVMRNAVDISPAAVILAGLIGGSLLGLVGVLLAIPLAASIKVLTQEVWIPRQDLV